MKNVVEKQYVILIRNLETNELFGLSQSYKDLSLGKYSSLTVFNGKVYNQESPYGRLQLDKLIKNAKRDIPELQTGEWDLFISRLHSKKCPIRITEHSYSNHYIFELK